MADFISLADAREAMKGNFIGNVLKVGDLSSGTKDGKDWTRKNFTIQDTSAEMILTAWNGEIKLLEYGKTYEFTGMWFKPYKEDVNLAFGKGGKAVEIKGGSPPTKQPSERTDTSVIPEPKPPTGPTDPPKFPLKQKLVHDEIWAFALVEAAKVYPLGTASADPNLTPRLILAQVFYKKNMDYYIHREGRAG